MFLPSVEAPRADGRRLVVFDGRAPESSAPSWKPRSHCRDVGRHSVQGDVEPRLALWSRRDPVSLLGAWGPNKTGWPELERTFHWVAGRLGSVERRDFRFDVDVAEVSADGQMAYSIGFGRFEEVLADGGTKPWTVRVTHVYRWEDESNCGW